MDTESSAIEQAHARATLYYHLAALFVYPDGALWESLEEFSVQDWQRIFSLLRWSDKGCARLQKRLRSVTQEQFLAEHLAIFGHTAAGELRPYEAGYDTHHVFQETQCLADIAGFYRAFGLEPCETRRERPDHIAVELEFMHVLSIKEAYALAQGWGEKAGICREAQSAFLRDHLGRWTPSFLTHLAERSRGGTFEMIAEATAVCVKTHCQDSGVEAGANDLEPAASSNAEGSNFPCMAHETAGFAGIAGFTSREDAE